MAGSEGKRVDELIRALNLEKQQAAQRLTIILGEKVYGSRLSEWSGKKKLTFQQRAVISLLHPDPVACAQWLRNGGPLPHVRPQGNEPAAGESMAERLVVGLQRVAGDVLRGRGALSSEPAKTSRPVKKDKPRP